MSHPRCRGIKLKTSRSRTDPSDVQPIRFWDHILIYYQLGMVTCPSIEQAGRSPTHEFVIKTGLIAHDERVDLVILENPVVTGRPGQKNLNIELVGYSGLTRALSCTIYQTQI